MANVKGGRGVASLHFGIKNPNTNEEHYPSSNGNWRYNKNKINELIENDEIYFGKDGLGKPKLKRFFCDLKDKGVANSTHKCNTSIQKIVFTN
jgi:adenine-specific DNA-methyltransferase